VIGSVGATYVSAQKGPQITRTEILRKPSSGLESKEVVVFIADMPPGGIAVAEVIQRATESRVPLFVWDPQSRRVVRR
jgi:hypothetical protein